MSVLKAAIALCLLCQLSYGQTKKASITSTSRYIGTVNKSQVRAALNYYSDGTVAGNYVSFKSGKKYYLKGNNYTKGKLVLREFSAGSDGVYRETSVSHLFKEVRNGKVHWVGTMRNHDGRNVRVDWTKK